MMGDMFRVDAILTIGRWSLLDIGSIGLLVLLLDSILVFVLGVFIIVVGMAVFCVTLALSVNWLLDIVFEVLLWRGILNRLVLIQILDIVRVVALPFFLVGIVLGGDILRIG